MANILVSELKNIIKILESEETTACPEKMNRGE